MIIQISIINYKIYFFFHRKKKKEKRYCNKCLYFQKEKKNEKYILYFQKEKKENEKTKSVKFCKEKEVI